MWMLIKVWIVEERNGSAIHCDFRNIIGHLSNNLLCSENDHPQERREFVFSRLMHIKMGWQEFPHRRRSADFLDNLRISQREEITLTFR